MIAPAIFTIYRDANTGLFSIVCSVEDTDITVQNNIRTREKAEAAIKIWRDREKRRVGA